MAFPHSDRGVGRPTVVAVAFATAALFLVFLLQQAARRNITHAGFWFDDVSFELSPGLTERLGGPLTEVDRHEIVRMASAELERAYAGLPIMFSDRRDAFYVVRVLQKIDDERFEGAAGMSHALVPLGGGGVVSFEILADRAIGHAGDRDRAAIVAGIGRGIGRTAAHEFAHQILVSVNLHASADPSSYEYAYPDRAAQFYGDMHWSFARPQLAARLGP